MSPFEVPQRVSSSGGSYGPLPANEPGWLKQFLQGVRLVGMVWATSDFELRGNQGWLDSPALPGRQLPW